MTSNRLKTVDIKGKSYVTVNGIDLTVLETTSYHHLRQLLHQVVFWIQRERGRFEFLLSPLEIALRFSMLFRELFCS